MVLGVRQESATYDTADSPAAECFDNRRGWLHHGFADEYPNGAAARAVCCNALPVCMGVGLTTTPNRKGRLLPSPFESAIMPAHS